MVTGLGGSNWLEVRQAYQQAVSDGRLDAYVKRRWRRSEEFAGWLTQEGLPILSSEQASALYRASGGRKSQEFRSNLIADIRDSLDFLLFDTIGLETRFAECASTTGAYYLAGAGREFMSYTLCLADPSLFAFWGSHSENALRRLGAHPANLNKGHLGLSYLDLLNAFHAVRLTSGLTDFRAVDEMAFFVSRKSSREYKPRAATV